MKINWSNIHYIIFVFIILNFVMIYFLKGTDDNKTKSLEKSTIENQPLIVFIANNETTNNKINSSLTESNIAEDIGRAIGDSGKSITLIDNGIKQFLNVIGNEDIIIAHNSLLNNEYNSISTILIMLFILVVIAVLATYLEKKSLDNRKRVINKKEVIESVHNTQYYLLNDD